MTMSACRGCTSGNLTLFLPLGRHPLANGFLAPGQLDGDEPRFPLDAYACLDCGLIQVHDHVPPNFFRHYVYVPSASDQMHQHFDDLAQVVAGDLLGSGAGPTVDIGCNDGLFLSHLARRGHRVLGIDPATNVVEAARARGVEVVNEYFTPDVARQVRATHGPAAVVVTTNTFHHIGDLDPFTEGVATLLGDGGVFVIELPHALEIVEQNQFDGIYHEHVSQFTVKSVMDHTRRFGLEVFRVDPLPVHGGSIRVFARKSAASDGSAVEPWIEDERRRGLFVESTYDRFRARVEGLREGLVSLLRDLKRAGTTLAAYGASARGNTVLNYCGIGPDILDYVVDRNPLKHGLYTPGTHIPVVAPDRLGTDPPDHVLLLAWNFAGEILRQQERYVAGGGRFIVPIPEPRILG